MEIAQITANGQITLPLNIRRTLKLNDGDKVAFIERAGEVIVINPIRLALTEAQEAFSGLAEELGLKSEDDVVRLCKEIRKGERFM